MAGKIGACVGAGSMKSAKWRQERGRRQGESTEKGERPSRKGMKEQSKGAGGRLGGRWVSEVQKKKRREKKGRKKRREKGKKGRREKIEAAVGIESLSGSRMPRVKIKERLARRSCYSSRFFPPLFFFLCPTNEIPLYWILPRCTYILGRLSLISLLRYQFIDGTSLIV